MSDLSSVFHSAFKNVFTECEGCKHYKKHIEMIARESKEPCKYCSRHYYDKFEEDRRMTREEAIKILKESHITYVAPDGNELKAEALDMAIHELEIQVQKAKCRKCENYRFGEDCFPYCELNRDEREPFVCEFEERTE